jgi:hypothetical protein
MLRGDATERQTNMLWVLIGLVIGVLAGASFDNTIVLAIFVVLGVLAGGAIEIMGAQYWQAVKSGKVKAWTPEK